MERRAIAIHGTVQGVGFRPFVYRLADRLQLAGFVKNQTGGVEIEVEGEAAPLDEFLAKLVSEPPPLAHIQYISWEHQSPRGERRFRIEPSDRSAGGPVVITPDAATCDACLAELFDPTNRRYLYPFINCTHCGPRLTIVTGAPYDRQRTTMAAFTMCAACRAEYEDPGNRRFHAEPTACPVCGPCLELRDAAGAPVESADPLADLALLLRQGRIAAVKGLGGFHLVCLASDERAVAELRRRKRREEKPLAVMVRDLAATEALVEIGQVERELLTSRQRPIVLLRKRAGAGVAPSVAPDNPYLGVMLPYTPLHELLLRQMGAGPAGGLVMTSGNRSDEPIAYENDEAVARLSGIADVFLLHNRDIHVRCDDSVTRVIGGLESPVRRSRGYAPQPISLPLACPVPTLAVGGQLKGTFALGRERQAFVSHHLGDLDHLQAYRAFERDVRLYEELFAIRPEVIVHDLHPDYAFTRYAVARAGADGSRLLAVQHHHAHMCSCMAEHGLDERVIGVCFDGTGYGSDGAIWGGEFLVGDYREFRRAAHLQYVGMPGGDRAVEEPWRMALAHLLAAGCPPDRLAGRLPAGAVRTVERMIEREFNTPMTSSAGRLFDAVAVLIGLRDRVTYEGQAAIELERLADRGIPDGSYQVTTVGWDDISLLSQPRAILTNEIVEGIEHDLAAGVAPTVIARRFHSTIARMIAQVCGQLRDVTGISKVVLSGGVFMNALLTGETCEQLAGVGLTAHRHRRVPTNDGGLCVGQLAAAAAMLRLDKNKLDGG